MADLLPPLINGTLREHYVILFGSAGIFALGVGGLAAWVGAWFGARRASRRILEQVQRETAQLAEQRHAALTQGIEAIAIEVERISEAQRFTSRLLSERASVPRGGAAHGGPRREPGTVTPH